MSSEMENLKNELVAHNQEHVLQFWEDLNEWERSHLVEDIREVNIPEALLYFRRCVEAMQQDQQKLDDLLHPISPESYGAHSRSSHAELTLYHEEGLKRIAEGTVGVLLLAGGQGTRLGVHYPKGMYDVGLPSRKTLFQIQAERIRRLEQLAFEHTNIRNHITWYIMTSEATMGPTIDFFKQHKYFGLNEENVVMFEQGLLPCFTLDGKIIMDTKYKIAKSPDGNGGVYRALKEKLIIDDMQKRGVKYLHAHSVDNILTKVADPVFVGYCIKKGGDCGAKVVEKAFPTEAVGVVCQVDGKYQVVEYSEITQATAEKRNPDGRLTFNAGNICNHFFTTDFLVRIINEHEKSLKLHVAKKKIPYTDSDGAQVIPDKPNGIKMEKFVFDVFQYADNFVTWEVDREAEFSGLKNGDSAEKDTPTTARQAIYRLHAKYVHEAGGKFDPSIPKGEIICEISPLVSYAGENLQSLVDSKVLSVPVHLEKLDDGNKTSNGTNGFHKAHQ